MLGLNGKLLDFIYPVGSYYETSDTSFNPNTAWGGTWLEDTKGRVTVALDSDDTDFDTISETGGSKEMQQHSHEIYVANGSNNAGSQFNNIAFVNGASISNNGQLRGTSKQGTGSSGNLQPYVVVKRWHRTA